MIVPTEARTPNGSFRIDGISTVPMHRNNNATGESISLYETLRQDPEWKLEFENDRSLVFVRDESLALDSRSAVGGPPLRDGATPSAPLRRSGEWWYHPSLQHSGRR